jgi:hypothetical protein
MSPIGKVFIVLNLIVSAVFVGFAGTYLQRATDWKAKHKEVADQLDAEKKRAQGELAALQSELQNKERELGKHVMLYQGADTEKKKLEDENKRLNSQIASLSADISKLQSASTTTAASIERATEDAKQAREMSIKSMKEKEEAATAKEAALKQLDDANKKIEGLQKEAASQVARIAELNQTTAEQEMILAVYKDRYGGPAIAQPNLSGRVEVVSSTDLVTIAVEKPADLELKAGWQFAIYGDKYKAEAVIQSARDNMAFCKIHKRVENATIQVGDRAATNLGF